MSERTPGRSLFEGWSWGTSESGPEPSEDAIQRQIEEAYQRGREEGYQQGKHVGYEQGANEAPAKIVDAGNVIVRQDVFAESIEAAYQRGLEEGYEKGREDEANRDDD